MNAGHTPDEPVQPEQQFSIEDLVPAFLLGATDAEETAAVLRHAGAPQVAGELERYAPLAEALLYAGPIVPPPATLGASLQAALGAAAQASAPTAAPPVTQPPVIQKSSQARAWQWPQLAAGAAAVGLLLLNLYWRREIAMLR